MAAAVKILANRIEEMENSFLTIFFEAATKMAQSTESKLFFIMESSDGIRKIGGTSELKQVFYAGRLFPRISDVAIGMDDSMGKKQTAAPYDTNLSHFGQKSRKRQGNFEPINAKKSKNSLENQWNNVLIKAEEHVDEEVVECEVEEEEQEMEEEDEQEVEEEDDQEVEDENFGVEDQPEHDCGTNEDDISFPSQWDTSCSGKKHKKDGFRGKQSAINFATENEWVEIGWNGELSSHHFY